MPQTLFQGTVEVLLKVNSHMHSEVVLKVKTCMGVCAQIGALIAELNELLADVTTDVQSHDAVLTRLSPANLAVFEFLPACTRQQLLLDRDPHGNVQARTPPAISTPYLPAVFTQRGLLLNIRVPCSTKGP
jgi:hypothetical protein